MFKKNCFWSNLIIFTFISKYKLTQNANSLLNAGFNDIIKSVDRSNKAIIDLMEQVMDVILNNFAQI